jgi:hypothetical protein
MLTAMLAALLGVGCDPSNPDPEPQPVRAAPAPIEIPALTFDPPELDFGDLLPETPVTKTVRIRNSGERAILIAEAISECACTLPTRPTGEIAPGGEIEAEITMDAGKRQGTTLRRKVTYLLEGGEMASLMVEGRVAMFVEHSPKEIDEPRLDEAGATEIVLEAKDGVPFAILGTDPDGIATASTTTALRQVAIVDWKRWRAAGSPVTFELYTDHPTAPPLGIVVRRAERP